MIHTFTNFTDLTLSKIINSNVVDEMFQAVINCEDLEQTKTLDFWVKFTEEHNFTGEPKQLMDFYLDRLFSTNSNSSIQSEEINEISENLDAQLSSSSRATSFEGM